jgi:hypothetical protein
MKRLVPAGIAFLLLAASLAASEAFARDRVVSSDRTATNLSAFGQGLAWSREDTGGEAHLVLQSFGAPTDVNVQPLAGGVFDPDLGQDASGATVAVYTRCAGVSGKNCDVYQYDFTRKRESKVAGASTSSCSEYAPSIWEGTVAFARSGSKRCRGLYVKGPKGAALRLNTRIPADTDIRSGRVAYLYAPDSTHTFIRVFEIRRGKSNLVIAGLRAEGERTRVSSPTFSGKYLYFLFEDQRRKQFQIGRSRAHQRSALLFSDRKLTGKPDSIALDGRAVFYTNGRGVFQANDPAPKFTARD